MIPDSEMVRVQTLEHNSRNSVAFGALLLRKQSRGLQPSKVNFDLLGSALLCTHGQPRRALFKSFSSSEIYMCSHDFQPNRFVFSSDPVDTHLQNVRIISRREDVKAGTALPKLVINMYGAPSA